jgi:hypothetical protein
VEPELLVNFQNPQRLIVVVLTKVDRVQVGDQDYWLDLLRKGAGRYFVTRLHAPDTEGRVTTWKQDREEEAKILSNQPWCEREIKRYLGTKNLIQYLSRRLAEMIKKRYVSVSRMAMEINLSDYQLWWRKYKHTGVLLTRNCDVFRSHFQTIPKESS